MNYDRQKCNSTGCDDYMTRPIDTDKMLVLCGKWINNDRDHSHAAPAASAETPEG